MISGSSSLTGIEHIFLDVAGTLLHKPVLFIRIQEMLANCEVSIEINEIIKRHKLLTEAIHFPDRPDKQFYREFNKSFLHSLGCVTSDKVLETLYLSVKNISWEIFPDANLALETGIPTSIISNWDHTLKDKLSSFFDMSEKEIFGSADLKVAKPDPKFFKRALAKIGVAPEKALYVGDSIRLDIEPAHILGMRTCLIDRHEIFSAHQLWRICTFEDLK